MGRLQGFSGGISEVRGQRRARAGSAAPTAKWPLRQLMLRRWRRVLQHPFCKGPRTDKCLGNGSRRSPHPPGQSRVGSARHIVCSLSPGTATPSSARLGDPPGLPGQAGKLGATVQARWGSHRLCMQEPLPLLHHFPSVTSSFPKFCHQKAPLSSP